MREVKWIERERDRKRGGRERERGEREDKPLEGPPAPCASSLQQLPLRWRRPPSFSAARQETPLQDERTQRNNWP